MKVSNPTFIIALAVVLWSCNNNKENAKEPVEAKSTVLVSTAGINASGPYFINDHDGNPVLCWTEEQSGRSDFISKFAVFNKEKNVFGKPITIKPSKGARAHPESMNKVAFKADGSIVAVYARKQPTEENPYAGFIMYTQSFDGGKQWSPERYLHTDTLATYGRSYFDLATLSDGEVGAVWLDGRLGDADNGSALFFAKTEEKNGFGKDKQIGESTCECCRTDLYVDQSGDVHVVYRDILSDSIRDIVHQVSRDNGQLFSSAKRISRDNWNIAGCPHTGPSLTENGAGIQVVWFTAGGGPGIYHTTSQDYGQTFSLRERISMDGRHPQLAALADDKLAIVWEEPKQKEDSHSEMHAHKAMKMHSSSLFGSNIILQVRDRNGIIKTVPVTAPDANASYPVLAPMEDGKILIAWRQEAGDKSEVYCKLVDL